MFRATKDPGVTARYYFDWDDVLPEGDSIVSATVAVTGFDDTCTVSTVTISDLQTSFTVTGGTEGRLYAATVSAVPQSDGLAVEQSIRLTIAQQ